MRYTQKLKLKLPEPTDPAKIEDISENFEKLDDLGAGVEAVKNGTGPGSLFLVSRHYQEPVKDALVCNGGYASVAQYPELYEVLGSKYGTQLSISNVSSQYGASAANGYPSAYNAKHDCFIGLKFENKMVNMIIYRRGSQPQIVGITGAEADGVNYVFTAGDFAFGRATGTVATKFLYNLATNTRITTKTTELNKLLTLDTFGKVAPKLAFTKNYIVYVGSSGTSSVARKISAVRISDFSLVLNDVPLGNVPSTHYHYAITNYDDINSDNFYIYAYHSDDVQVWRVTITPGASTIEMTQLGATTITGNMSNGGAIVGGRFVLAYDVSNGLRFYAAALSGSTASTAKETQLSITDYNATQKYKGTGLSAIRNAMKIGDGWVLVLNGHKDAIFFENNIPTRVASLTSGYVEMVGPSVPSDKVCTLSAAYSSPNISKFKLPSISVSESLVYMRTKGT